MYARIFAALDGSRSSRLALDEAIAPARDSGGLHVAVCVGSDAPRRTGGDSGVIDQGHPVGGEGG
ncbi:universal stress protein, partial [Burkholderia contaminans]